MKTAEKWTDNLDQNRVIKGKTEEGRNFQIALEAISKDVTMVKVRIDTFGDEVYSKKIQEGVAKNLKK
jgi:transcriptional regulator NrdR family protein